MANGLVTEMPQYSALCCVSGIWHNNEKPLISNELRFIVTCLPTAALWVLFHCGRHTFAVHSLMRQVRNGADIYCTLPILSVFLGHKKLSDTETYVRLTQEMYPDVLKLESSITSFLYPALPNNPVAYER